MLVNYDSGVVPDWKISHKMNHYLIGKPYWYDPALRRLNLVRIHLNVVHFSNEIIFRQVF